MGLLRSVVNLVANTGSIATEAIGNSMDKLSKSIDKLSDDMAASAESMRVEHLVQKITEEYHLESQDEIKYLTQFCSMRKDGHVNFPFFGQTITLQS